MDMGSICIFGETLRSGTRVSGKKWFISTQERTRVKNMPSKYEKYEGLRPDNRRYF